METQSDRALYWRRRLPLAAEAMPDTRCRCLPGESPLARGIVHRR